MLRRVKKTLSNVRFNAPACRTRDIIHWLGQNDVKVMERPPYSPDLNPVEHIWAKSKDRAQQTHSGLENIVGGREKVQKRTAKALPKVWDSIELGSFESLWKGNYTFSVIIEVLQSVPYSSCHESGRDPGC